MLHHGERDMKARTILSVFMILPLCWVSCTQARTQTAKPAAPSHLQAADTAARKQLAACMAEFKNHPDDAVLRDKIIVLALGLKPAPLIPQLARTEFAKAAAQMKTASTADDFKTTATLFEQVAQQAPWYADAYLNAAFAFVKASDYDSADRNLTLYMASVRKGVDTQQANDLRADIEQQQATQEFQQALQKFEASPKDAARQQIIKLAQAMKTPPSIPEEAHGHYIMATAFAEKAKEGAKAAKDDSGLKLADDEFGQAIGEYKAALLAAPWWADAYKKLAMAQEAANQYDDAIASLNVYLLTQPADARDARDEIYKLKVDKQAAADQKAAEEKRKWDEQYSPQAVAAREQKSFEDLLRKIDGRRYTHAFPQKICGPLIGVIDIHGRFLTEGTIYPPDINAGPNLLPGYHPQGGQVDIQGRVSNKSYRSGQVGIDRRYSISEEGDTITLHVSSFNPAPQPDEDYVYVWQR
jgi:hypothetical protein